MRIDVPTTGTEPTLVALLLGSRISNPQRNPRRTEDGALELRLKVEETSVFTQMLTFSSALRLDLRGAVELHKAKAVVAIFVHRETVSLVVHQNPKSEIP